MSWLEQHKQKFAAEDSEKKRQEEADHAAWQSRDNAANKELKDYVNKTLKDLVGKKTKDGKVLRLEYPPKYNQAYLYADDEKLLILSFWYTEHEEYDNDGCSHGTGQYYLREEMTTCRPYKCRSGYDRKANETRCISDENLADYLLKFIDL